MALSAVAPAAVTAATEEESAAISVEPIEAFAGDGTNNLSPNNLLPGDIIILGTADTFFDFLIPGKYSHTELYCGTVKSGEKIWDRDHHEWMATGTHYVIHSTKGDVSGDGLGYSTWEEGVNNHADFVMVLRVLKANGGTLSSSQRNGIVNWAKGKLTGGTDGYPIGPQYDWGWLSKQIGVDSMWPAPNGYYCCELIWAAYYDYMGIDLDAETSPFDIAVTNDDLWHSQYTSVIAYEFGSTTFNAPSDICRLSVFVDEIYYDDDYDPWPSGSGEEYMISRSGLGNRDNDNTMLATEQQAPGNGKIGQAPGHWSRSGKGALNWNKYFYSLVPNNRYLRLRIEAWEKDGWPNADDQYPVFQKYWSYSTWKNYRGDGWISLGYRVDKGDCRYTIQYKIDTVY
jgi:uncharacterized protein YycO